MNATEAYKTGQGAPMADHPYIPDAFGYACHQCGRFEEEHVVIMHGTQRLMSIRGLTLERMRNGGNQLRCPRCGVTTAVGDYLPNIVRVASEFSHKEGCE